MNTLRIGNRRVGPGISPFIIAEAGVNHNGRLSYALKLVDAAAAAGADAVKFQTFKAAQVVTSIGRQASYQQRNTRTKQSQIAMLKKLEFQSTWYRKIQARCRQRGIQFMSTPHGGFASIDELAKQHLTALKFGSGELTNIPVLQYAARLNLPMIVATGMASMTEVQAAVHAIHQAGNTKIVLLHATTNYPCPLNEVNLLAMLTMAKETSCFVGYSDHTIGIEVPYTAAALGATVIEKHLTLDRTMPGPDHRASTEPNEFKQMVSMIRRLDTILGSPIKRPNPSEQRMIPTVRKSLVTTQPITAGQRLSANNIGIKRPGTGLSPALYLAVIGQRAKRNIPADTVLKKNDYAS